VGLTAAIAAGVLVWLWNEKRRDDSLALALVLGGALGNILDRVRYGYVLDFADLHFGEIRPFLVFNVGDAAITIGVLLLLVHALFGGPAPRSALENQVLRDAGADRADPGARSVAGDPNTSVVDKGSTTQSIVAAPAGAGQNAKVSTPQ